MNVSKRGNRKSWKSLLSGMTLFLLLLVIVTSPGSAKGATEAKEGKSEGDKFAAVVKHFFDKELFTGTVLVSEGDKTIYSGSFGKASIELDVDNNLDTKFLVGSNTKCFVATVIMQMVAEGTLSLDGTIKDYLPYYTSPVGKQVTIRHLLEMSSGIPDYQTDPGTEQYNLVRLHPWSLKKFVTKFCMPDKLNFAPGTKYQYCDGDYYILGAIIKEKTGSFKATLQKKILDAAGMTNTGTYHFTPAAPETGKYQFLPVIPGLADGYVYPAGLLRGYEDKAYKPELQQAGSVFTSGNMYSNVKDYQRWSQALSTDLLLPANYREMMFTPRKLAKGLGFKCLYATYGWNIQYLDPKTYKPPCNCPGNPADIPEEWIETYFFAGRYPGYISAFMRFPIVPAFGPDVPEKKNAAIVVFSNYDNFYGAVALALVLRDVLFNIEPTTVNNIDDAMKLPGMCGGSSKSANN
jgi:CubicO group peptidase (beta-lactamase class C family)